MGKTYYEILEISITATQQEIKEAYRKLAKKYHPDVNLDNDTTKEMQEITEAYVVLSDLSKRKEYDNELKRKGIYYKQESKSRTTSSQKSDSSSSWQYYSYTKTKEESESDLDEFIKIFLKKYQQNYRKARKYNTERANYFNSNINLNNIDFIYANILRQAVSANLNFRDTKEDIIHKENKILRK